MHMDLGERQLFKGSLVKDYADPYFPPRLHNETFSSVGRVRAALARAARTFREVTIDEHVFLSERKNKKLVRDLCQKYWLEKEWRDVPAMSVVKPFTTKISRKFAALLADLDSLPDLVQSTIFVNSDYTLEPARMRHMLERWKSSCDSISLSKVKLGRPSNLHIDLALDRTSTLWKVLTNYEFPKSFATDDDETDFVSSASAFALRIMQAVDPKIGIKEVRNAIKNMDPGSAREEARSIKAPPSLGAMSSLRNAATRQNGWSLEQRTHFFQFEIYECRKRLQDLQSERWQIHDPNPELTEKRILALYDNIRDLTLAIEALST